MFNDGGTAFPQLNVEVISDSMAVQNVSGGMSLWDFYAAAALTGMLSSEVGGDGLCPPMTKGEDYKTTIIKAAFGFADAAIAEREKRSANRPSP